MKTGNCKGCGKSGELSKEHAFPGWLGGVVAALGDPVASVGHKYEGPPGSGILREWTAGGVDVQVHAVCEPCNNGWMSDLEQVVKPLLSPLVRASRTTLTSLQCRVLTRWYIKTALMLELAGDRTQRVAPPELDDWFSSDIQPKRHLTLWIGSTKEPVGILSASRSAQTQIGMRAAKDAWLHVMCCGHVVLASLVTSLGAKPPILQPPLSNALTQFWPAPLILSYPPHAKLSAEQVSLVPHLLATSLT